MVYCPCFSITTTAEMWAVLAQEAQMGPVASGAKDPSRGPGLWYQIIDLDGTLARTPPRYPWRTSPRPGGAPILAHLSCVPRRGTALVANRCGGNPWVARCPASLGLAPYIIGVSARPEPLAGHCPTEPGFSLGCYLSAT